MTAPEAAIAPKSCRRTASVNSIQASVALIVTITALGQNGPASNAVGAFPSWPKTDPEAIARGKQVYGANCAYCHGEDARGGENGGTNLIRSDVFMKDRNGEFIAEFLRSTDSN